MKILWLTSICPQFACNITGMNKVVTGGWLDQSGEMIINHNHKLVIVCPCPGTEQHFSNNNLEVYTFNGTSMRKYNRELSDKFSSILRIVEPDVIHIHGTEFPHSLSMLEAARLCSMGDLCVVSIQGLVSIYANHYFSGLSASVVYSYTFRDMIQGNIYSDYLDFVRRGVFERRTIESTNHIIGRTNWDKAIALQYNPDSNYHHNNETLRKAFYYGSWSYDTCEKHSIFVSQSSYPIKGFHIALEAFTLVLQKYPDSILYVTGTSPFDVPIYRIDSYKLYLKKLLKKYGIVDRVVFTGMLDEASMKERFLKSNVFVMCSSIENSPNSLGEAMLLGVPVVASDVGGVSSMITHDSDGFVYPYDEPYMLAYYICETFRNESNSDRVINEKKHARLTHDAENNYDCLIKIYEDIRVAKK